MLAIRQLAIYWLTTTKDSLVVWLSQ